MDKTRHNETWGIVTEDEHAAMRLTAKTCTRCGMLATVDPVAHQDRYGHAPEFWFAQQLHRWDGSQMRFTVVHDNRQLYRVRFLDGTSREYRATSEQDARGQAQTGPSVHITSVGKAPFRIGHHAQAVTADGRLLVYRPSMAGEVLADFPHLVSGPGGLQRPDPWPGDGGLSQAREWARKTLAEHPRAVAVNIRESHQAFEGTSWTMGPHVETVRRSEEDPFPVEVTVGRVTRAVMAEPLTEGEDPARGPWRAFVREAVVAQIGRGKARYRDTLILSRLFDGDRPRHGTTTTTDEFGRRWTYHMGTCVRNRQATTVAFADITPPTNYADQTRSQAQGS